MVWAMTLGENPVAELKNPKSMGKGDKQYLAGREFTSFPVRALIVYI